MHLTMLRTCSGCGKTVKRKDCHKNRYGEYHCRTCQRTGVVSKRPAYRNLIIKWRKIGPALWFIVIFSGLGVLALWLLVQMFESLEF
jgi:hypothetical protein